MKNREQGSFVFVESSELVLKVLCGRAFLLKLATQVEKQRLVLGAFFGQALGFGIELVTLLGGRGDGSGERGMLFTDSVEFFEAVLQAGCLLGKLSEAAFSVGKFLLPREDAVLQILMIRLRGCEALLRVGVCASQRGNDGLQATDFLDKGEMILRVLF